MGLHIFVTHIHIIERILSFSRRLRSEPKRRERGRAIARDIRAPYFLVYILPRFEGSLHITCTGANVRLKVARPLQSMVAREHNCGE